MSTFKDSVLQKALCVLYLVLELLLPIVCVLYLAFHPPLASSLPSWVERGNRLALFFVALPAYSVYAWLVLKEHFPATPRAVLQLFLPIVVSFVFSLMWWSEDTLLDVFIFEALPIFLGLSLLFYMGLFYLVWQQQKRNLSLTECLAFLCLSCVLFAPAGIICIQGWELSQSVGILQNALASVDYFGSILLTVWANTPILKSLYASGEL